MPTWRPPKLDGSVNIDMMKPIEPEIRAILYEKGVESFICSNNYFRKRLTNRLKSVLLFVGRYLTE